MPTFEASPDLRLHYLVDDCTEPWTEPETILLLFVMRSVATAAVADDVESPPPELGGRRLPRELLERRRQRQDRASQRCCPLHSERRTYSAGPG